MKKKIFYILSIAFICSGLAKAQKVLLPFGQFSQQAWTAKYYFAKSGEAGPSDDWFAKNYNESAWKSLVGPISSVEGGLQYYNTIWKEEYGTYWVRRHFKVNRINELRDIFFYAIHDDGCIAYLNGTLIYDINGVVDNPYYYTVNFDEDMRNLLQEGDNVLAIRVSDSGGLYAYMDNGIYGYSLKNGDFNNNNGWTGNYDRHNRDGNTIGYYYGRTFACEQTIEDAQAGLYRLSANACGLEYYYDYNTAWDHQKDEIPARLFINDDESPIPSAFTEMADYDYGYCWDIDGKFVPYYVDGTSTAFKNGMYQCEVWSYYEPDQTKTMTVGIHSDASNEINRWAAWDNMDLTYYTESEVKAMLDSIVIIVGELNKKYQNKDIKNRTAKLIATAKSASKYSDKARAFVDLKYHEISIRRSIEAYENLEATRKLLAGALGKVSKFTSPATIKEANLLNQTVLNAYRNGTYTNEDVESAIEKMETMVIRLGYIYLDITVNVPGAMGDSILSKVENFIDVKSIKLSGTLNDDDLSTIQTRLSQLREIDMTDVKMTTLPNSFFYQRSLLEIVKLPAQLTTIGEYAFYQCYGIAHIDFPTTLTTIKRYAFSECDNLQEVILPEGLNSIEERAFNSCDNNKYIKLPRTLESISSYAFYYNVNLKNVDFAEGLTHIYDCAFYDCYNLNSLQFPKSLYYIGNSAFAYNRSLSSIEFNEGLYQIRDNAFYDCDALTEVTLPSSLVLAYESPFDYCDNLMKVTCLSIEPPYMTDQIPYGLEMDGRELYVPALSINAYKQTSGWDKFQTIKPIDYLPENFTVLGDLKLTLPESIPADYKPNVSVIYGSKGTGYNQYGSLTVNGDGTLSMSKFSMSVWDPAYEFDYYNRSQNYCSLVNNSHLRADSVTINIDTKNDRWNFISLPFDVNISDIQTTATGTTNWVIRKYDGEKRAQGETSETWVKITEKDILHAGEGYIIQSSRYIDNNRQSWSRFQFNAINNANKNNIFRTSDVTVALNEYESEFAHNRSWNLIGNPYPCYYDTRYMDFEAPITVWNMRNNTYEAFSPVDDSYILCPGEAFFVQRPIDNGSIVFSKDGRQTNRNARTIEAPARAKMNRANTATTIRTIVNISLSDGNNTDRTRIVLNDDASLLYELNKDASKFLSSDKSISQIFTSSNGVNFAINERPLDNGMVSLCTYIGNEGLYTITLENKVNGYKVILEDKAEKKKIVLTSENSYTFSTKAGTYSDRFVLHFTSETTGIENVPSIENDDAVIYSTNGIKLTNPTKNGIYIQNGKKILLNK